MKDKEPIAEAASAAGKAQLPLTKVFEILQILGWSRFDKYESDMQDLGIDPTYN